MPWRPGRPQAAAQPARTVALGAGAATTRAAHAAGSCTTHYIHRASAFLQRRLRHDPSRLVCRALRLLYVHCQTVQLCAAQPTAATLEIMGETRTVPPSQTISTQFEAPREQVVTIVRDARLQYRTGAVINGRRAQVMVDTGANLVALSSAQARQMNIDYSGGKPSRVQTASGMGDAYAITLDTVSIGGIEVRNVPAMVVKGDYPAMILLGMSYLRHVSMQEKNGVLSLFRSQ